MNKERLEMLASGVYLSSPTNSTTFTTCCKAAIGDEPNCPVCHQPVEPQGRNARWAEAYAPYRRAS